MLCMGKLTVPHRLAKPRHPDATIGTGSPQGEAQQPTTITFNLHLPL